MSNSERMGALFNLLVPLPSAKIVVPAAGREPTREMRFKKVLTFMLLAAFHTGMAQEIKREPEDVSNSVGSVFKDPRVVYSVATGPDVPCKILLVANNIRGRWFIDLLLGNLANDYTGCTTGAITGDDGILLKCIDRFLADNPGAIITTVDLDPRASAKVWSDALAKISPRIKKWDGAVGDVETYTARRRKIRSSIEASVEKSPEVKSIADRLATHLMCDVWTIRLDTDGILFVRKGVTSKKWSDLLGMPNDGIMPRTAAIAISFKPKGAKDGHY